MPKINVYVSDDLAEAVKESGVPVSAICQRALEQSVKRVNAIRAVAFADLTGDPDLPRFTERAKSAVKRAIRRASGEVTTAHLLHGVLTEPDNLALQVLAAMEVPTPRLDLPPESDEPATRFGGDAANALE